MSFSFAKGAWEVRWRDPDGRQRSKRFQTETAAREFDAAIHDHRPAARSGRIQAHGAQAGVYSYQTASGTRWRYVIRRSDGTQTSKRGFKSEKAARDNRRRLIEQIERGEVRHTRTSFGAHWHRWLAARKPYLEHGTWQGYEIDGRKRLLPAFEHVPLARLDSDQIQAWLEQQAERINAGEIAVKTINNTLGTLVVCLNDAAKRGLIASNPALEVRALPAGHIEREYLRLHEIPIYLDSCSEIYRPLAELLIGTGMRISEALALRVGDLELTDTGGAVIVYRSSKRGTDGSTKSDRFRSVEIGPALSATLRHHLDGRTSSSTGDHTKQHVFAMPVRQRKTDNGRWQSAGAGEPFDRTTVSRDWHKAALQDASLRDMPLHALRHTAAAAWLAAGNSLMYVQRQLGHADISTTERYYGHLERRVLAAGAAATEEAIASAGNPRPVTP